MGLLSPGCWVQVPECPPFTRGNKMFEVQICNDHAEDPADDIYTALFQSQDLKKAQLFYQQHRSNWPICTIRLIEVLRKS
jgi:hypothetical protein